MCLCVWCDNLICIGVLGELQFFGYFLLHQLLPWVVVLGCVLWCFDVVFCGGVVVFCGVVPVLWWWFVVYGLVFGLSLLHEFLCVVVVVVVLVVCSCVFEKS